MRQSEGFVNFTDVTSLMQNNLTVLKFTETIIFKKFKILKLVKNIY